MIPAACVRPTLNPPGSLQTLGRPCPEDLEVIPGATQYNYSKETSIFAFIIDATLNDQWLVQYIYCTEECCRSAGFHLCRFEGTISSVLVILTAVRVRDLNI